MSDNQREMMLHALGLDRQKVSYRNAYCVPVGTPDDAEWAELVSLGMAKQGQSINGGRDRYYYVTEEGQAIVRTATAE